MERRLFIAGALFLSLALAGCATKQFSVNGGEPHDHFGYLGDGRGLLQIGPSNTPKVTRIIDAESYAIGPDGMRYGIATETHDYDRRHAHGPYSRNVRDRVYLVDARGRRVRRDWSDGRWTFHFAMNGPAGRDTRDFELLIGTRNYNPLTDGPPN